MDGEYSELMTMTLTIVTSHDDAAVQAVAGVVVAVVAVAVAVVVVMMIVAGRKVSWRRRRCQTDC